jgi:MFS family permease
MGLAEVSRLPPSHCMTIQPQYRIYACFFLFALTAGAMMSRLPDLQEHLQVTQGELGLTLIAMSIGSLISLTFSAPLIDRLGPRTTALITVLGTSICLAAVPWLPTAPAVFAALFGCGLLAGALEINLNVETDRIEAQTGNRYMSRAHGSWSLGFFVTALLGAGIRQLGMPMQWHLALTSGAALIIAGILLYGMVPAPARTDGHQGETPKIAFPSWGLLPLCIIGMAAFLCEGVSVDWSAIYMRDIFHSEPFIGGLGLTLFGGSMAIARLSADPFVSRHGPRRVAVTLLTVATAGAALVGFAPVDWMALVGFTLLGIGCSAVYPLAVSAAAQRTDRPAAVNVAALGQISFVVFFLGPPILGFIAQYLNIRISYLIVLPVLVLGLSLSRALPTKFTPAPIGLDIEPAGPHG